jgi:predicted RNA-binding Zn-ribbon protein involved in translation (DUF1610 family)
VAFAQAPAPGQKYVCPPCGCFGHGPDQEFNAPGVCPACGMDLIPKAPEAPKAGAWAFLTGD